MNIYREAFTHIKKFPREFWIVIIGTLVNQVGNMAVVFLVVYATQYLHLTLMQSATAFAFFGSTMLLSSLFIGNLIDHLGAGRVMIAAVFLNGITLLIMPMIHHLFLLNFMCILWGIFYGTFRPASQTFVSFLSVEGMHKITFSIYRLAINLGMSVGPAIGGYLAVHSYPGIFIVNGIGNILAGVVLLIGLINSSWLTHRPVSAHKKMLSLKWLKRDSLLCLFLFGMIPVSMVFYQHGSTLPVFLKENLNLSLSFYGLLFTINTLLIVCFELLLNIAIQNWTYRINFMLGALLVAAGFAGNYFATSGLEIILLSIAWTLGEMILYPSASSYIAEIAPEGQRGTYMSLYSMATNSGLLLGPWVGAVAMQYLGVAALWIGCGLCGIVSVLLFGFLAEPKK